MGLFNSYDDRRILARLARIEAQLDTINRHLGLATTPQPDNAFPPDAANLALAGDKIGAIKTLRAAKGLDLKEAKDAVEEFWERGGR